MSALLPDRAVLKTFIDVMFRHADPETFVIFKAFGDEDLPVIRQQAMQVSDPELVEKAVALASYVATQPVTAVFNPATSTYANVYQLIGRWSSKEEYVANGLDLSVDADTWPTRAYERLTAILGPPTIVVASGGVWRNEAENRDEDKLHLYWRLAAPAKTGEERKLLKHVRALACTIIQGDSSHNPLNHGLRWPGSVHRKKTPKLARIVECNADVDINLFGARGRLLACQDQYPDLKKVERERKTNPTLLAKHIDDVKAVMEIVPNEDLHYDAWCVMGLAIWAASGGEGEEIFDTWSQKSSKYDCEVTEAVWERFVYSPPDKIGMGSLVHHARQVDSTWQVPSSRKNASDYYEAPPSDETAANAEGASKTEGAEGAGEKVEFGFRNSPEATEDQAAIQFAERYRGKLRFCHSHGCWFVWDGSLWKQNGTGLAFHFARELAREMGRGEDPKTQASTGRAAFAGAVEKFARSDPTFAVDAEAWDRDPFLLGTPSGTVDLRNGLLRPSRPEDGITRTTSVAPADTADCPTWLRFLNDATGDDHEMIRFLQGYAGYCLSGSTREHALVFIHGPGGNGKSVLVNALTGVSGTYAVSSAMETFVASAGARHPADIAMLKGARLVTASETEENAQWAESRIKSLTGGDTVSARFMRQDFFSFVPQFKLLFVGNHRPGLRNVDEAARRRFNLVRFDRKPDVPDRHLEEKLRLEYPAILRWAIDGCLAWQREGLLRPASLKASTTEYFDAQDVFGSWLDEECDVEVGNVFKTATSEELFTAWTRYAKNAGEPSGTKRSFADQMTHRGLENHKGAKGKRGYRGVRLKQSAGFFQDDEAPAA